jgi:stage III sporulation protein AF
MMEALRNWIVIICTTIFFITAIEMILPSNNMKKYCKFVLGLVLVSVIINPIVKFLNNGNKIDTFISNSVDNFEKMDSKNVQGGEYKDKSIKNTTEVFQKNISKICESKVKEKYPNLNSIATVKAKYDEKQNSFCITSIDIQINDSSIKKVKKVEINAVNNMDEKVKDDSEKRTQIKDYLSKELQVSKDVIEVYKG